MVVRCVARLIFACVFVDHITGSAYLIVVVRHSLVVFRGRANAKERSTRAGVLLPCSHVRAKLRGDGTPSDVCIQ